MNETNLFANIFETDSKLPPSPFCKFPMSCLPDASCYRPPAFPFISIITRARGSAVSPFPSRTTTVNNVKRTFNYPSRNRGPLVPVNYRNFSAPRGFSRVSIDSGNPTPAPLIPATATGPVRISSARFYLPESNRKIGRAPRRTVPISMQIRKVVKEFIKPELTLLACKCKEC